MIDAFVGRRNLHRRMVVMHGVGLVPGRMRRHRRTDGRQGYGGGDQDGQNSAGQRQGQVSQYEPSSMAIPPAGSSRMLPQPGLPQFTRATSTRLSENVGARPMLDHASDEMEFTEPSERLSERQ